MAAQTVTDETFQRDVFDASFERPIVVVLHAGEQDPSATYVTDVADAIADHDLECTLVSIDAEQNPQATAVFGIQIAPSTKGVLNGILRAEITGAEPRAAIDAFLAAVPLDQAEQALASNDEALLRAALEADPLEPTLTIALGRLVLDRGDSLDAHLLLLTVGHHPIGAGLFERSRVLANPSSDPELATCLETFTTDLAGSLNSIIPLIDDADEARLDTIRRIFTGVFAERPSDDPLVLEVRQRLAPTQF